MNNKNGKMKQNNIMKIIIMSMCGGEYIACISNKSY